MYHINSSPTNYVIIEQCSIFNGTVHTAARYPRATTERTATKAGVRPRSRPIGSEPDRSVGCASAGCQSMMWPNVSILRLKPSEPTTMRVIRARRITSETAQETTTMKPSHNSLSRKWWLSSPTLFPFNTMEPSLQGCVAEEPDGDQLQQSHPQDDLPGQRIHAVQRLHTTEEERKRDQVLDE